jgi:hypothetical protein
LADATTTEAGVGEITPSQISNAASSNAASPYLETSTQPTLEHKKTQVEKLLWSVLELDGTQDAVQVKSLAMSPNHKTKMATVDFRTQPARLSSSRYKWHFDIPGSYAENNGGEDDDDIIPKPPKITIDTHFKGITVLRSFKNVSQHKIE